MHTVGPTVDPLDEGCDCLFCQFDEEATLAATAEPQAKSTDHNIQRAERVCDDRIEFDDAPNDKKNRQPNGRSNGSRRNQDKLAEETEKHESLPGDHRPSDRFPERTNDHDPSVSRYDSVGGVEPIWETDQQTIFPIELTQAGKTMPDTGELASEPDWWNDGIHRTKKNERNPAHPPGKAACQNSASLDPACEPFRKNELEPDALEKSGFKRKLHEHVPAAPCGNGTAFGPAYQADEKNSRKASETDISIIRGSPYPIESRRSEFRTHRSSDD